MSDNPNNPIPRGPARAPAPVASVAAHGPSQRRGAAPHALTRDDDPVSDWLLERDDLDDAEFSVLFGIHKLASRPGRSGWIGHGELCRSTGLGPVELAGVVSELRRRGLLGRVRHRVETGCARYLLIAGPGSPQGERASRQ